MLTFTPTELDEARALNRKLALLPRMKPGSRAKFMLAQVLLLLVEALTPRAKDVRIERRRVSIDARTLVTLRILTGQKPVQGVYVDLHGGGWVLGNAEMDDRLNRQTIEDCGFQVLSVDYRLAQRHPLSTLVDDCETALLWILQQPAYASLPIFLRGESAGAHLAVAALQRLQKRGLASRIAGVLLYYGVYDMSGSPSVRAAGPETLVLHGPTLQAGLAQIAHLNSMAKPYLRDPAVSPLYGDLTSLPPALLVAGTLDPLLDDTRQLAARWQAENGNATLLIVPEAPHGFIHLKTAMARQVTRHAHRWLNSLTERA